MRVKLSLRKVLFIVVFLLGIIVFQNNVKATTVADLRAKFPAGKFWNHYAGSDHYYKYGLIDTGSCNNPDGWTNEPCIYHDGTTAGYGKPDCNSFDGGQECLGFARKLFYDYYGVKATSREKTYDKNSIKPGDVVRYTGGGAADGGHEVWVIGVDNEKLIVAECNYYKPCEISWDRWVYKNNINISYIYPAPYAINDNQTPSTPSTPATPATVKVSSIKLSSTAITLTKTQSRGLVATVYPSNATNKALTWSSSNTSVATVSSTGNIKAVGKGTATITAKAKDGSGVTKTCKVTVNYAEPNVLYSSHVQNIGWQGYVSNGAMSGTSGQSLRLEAMKIKLDSQYSGGISHHGDVTPNAPQNNGVGGGAGYFDGGKDEGGTNLAGGGSCTPWCYPLATTDVDYGISDYYDALWHWVGLNENLGSVYFYNVAPGKMPSGGTVAYGETVRLLEGGVGVYTPVSAMREYHASTRNSDCGIRVGWVYSVEKGGCWEGLAPDGKLSASETQPSGTA